MNNIKIETLTPVHIGSGNLLHNNNDFVVSGNDIYVIDPAKILSFIGVENINYWVNIIEKNDNIIEFVKHKGKGATPPMYAQRKINSFARIKSNDTLKECIHNGFGVPYIPGSSIKGGIRTAILATLASKQFHDSSLQFNGKPSATPIEKQLFGNDANSDIFRFIKVGDAYFEKGCEIASRMININQTQDTSLIDERKSQIVESIDLDNQSTLQLKVDYNQYVKLKKNWNHKNPIGDFPIEISDISKLFKLINNHTRKLVSDEIDYWYSIMEENYYGAEDYIETMKDVLSNINSCEEGKSCVLRIGHASGWRFITGAWSENYTNFYADIVPSARPKNDIYKKYVFPKSRRLDEDNMVFGFIKLSIL